MPLHKIVRIADCDPCLAKLSLAALQYLAQCEAMELARLDRLVKDVLPVI